MAGEAPLERQPDEDLFQRVLARTVAPPQSSSRADVSANAASTRSTRSGNRDRYSDSVGRSPMLPRKVISIFNSFRNSAFRPGPTQFSTICSICGRGPWAHACTNDFTASSVFGFIELVVNSGCMARTLKASGRKKWQARSACRGGRHAERACHLGKTFLAARLNAELAPRSMPFIPRRTVLTPPAATRHPRLSHPNDARELSGREKSGGPAIRNHLWGASVDAFDGELGVHAPRVTSVQTRAARTSKLLSGGTGIAN